MSTWSDTERLSLCAETLPLSREQYGRGDEPRLAWDEQQEHRATIRRFRSSREAAAHQCETCAAILSWTGDYRAQGESEWGPTRASWKH
jgi:hypothetical protein